MRWVGNGCVGCSRLGPLGADKVGPSGHLDDPLRCALATPGEPGALRYT